MQISKASESRQILPADQAKDRDRLKEVSREFEALFLEIVLETMRKASPKSGFIDGGNAEDVYRSMLDSEYAKMMAQSGQTGLARSIEDQLASIYEKKEQAVKLGQKLARDAYSLQAVEHQNILAPASK